MRGELFSCSTLSDSFTAPWTAARQAPQPIGFPRQVYWSGLPFPSPGTLPDPGIELASLVSPELAGGFLLNHQGSQEHFFLAASHTLWYLSFPPGDPCLLAWQAHSLSLSYQGGPGGHSGK